MDVFSESKRSAIMAAVRSRGNLRTELRLIDIFKRSGITGWRRNYPLFGKPDFVFRPERVAVFVDGCFWHGCEIHATIPTTNTAFWSHKIGRNIERDLEVSVALRKRGWRVVRLWQHDLGDSKSVCRKINRALGRQRSLS